MRSVCLLVILEFLWPRNVHAFVSSTIRRNCQHKRSTNQPFLASDNGIALLAVKSIYKWKVLPSGSVTGICDDGIVTTSALKQPEKAYPNTIVTTSSGSQYKLLGESVGGSNPFALTSSSSSSSPSLITPTTTNSDDTGSITSSIIALVTVSGIFVWIVLQNIGLLGSLPNSDDISYNVNSLSWRAAALLMYTIGIVIATIQLIDDANKLSKN
jgi:hypothetical protein